MQPPPPGARIPAMLTAEHGYRPASDRAWPGGLLHAGAAMLAVAALIAWLQLLGRPLVCPCGIVRLWAPLHDSQHLADWYSLLHISFGLGLFAVVAAFQPRWRFPLRLAVAVLGSVAWEAIENVPAVIALFNEPAGAASYRGDTILNALGDTFFVAIGCGIAARLPWRAVLAVAGLIELGVWVAIRDGLIVGLVRLILAA